MAGPTSPVLVLPRGRQYRLNLTTDTFIGSQGCAVIVSDPGVAPQHARITPSGGRFVIQDLGGRTRVNGVTINSPVLLQSGDVIGIGRTNLVFHGPATPPKRKAAAPPKPVAPPSPLPSGAPAPLPTASVAARARGEQTLWEGRPSPQFSPIASLTTRYKLTTERLLQRKGLLGRSLEEIELIRVKDIRLEIGILQRVFSLGTITIFTVDQTAPQLELKNIPQADRVREAIRNAVRDERQKQGVRFAELMT